MKRILFAMFAVVLGAATAWAACACNNSGCKCSMDADSGRTCCVPDATGKPTCSGSCCTGGDGDYSLIFMSDTHYDKQEYDVNTVLPSYWTGEHARNMNMWDNGEASISYVMLDQVKAAVDESTGFILHAGDLTQGDFDSVASTEKANKAAIADITSRTGLPLYVTIDNHDYCRTMSYMDPGRYTTYNPLEDARGCKPVSSLRVEMANAAKMTLKDYAIDNLRLSRLTNSCFMTKECGDDVFIFTQASNPGLKYLAQELARYPKEKVRHTFVIIHIPPVLGKSYGTAKPWQSDCFHYYSYVGDTNNVELKARDPELQAQILADLAAREAIVLSGHKHYFEVIDAVFPEGTIHQFMVNVNDVSYNWLPCESLQDWPAHAAADNGTVLDKGDATEISRYMLWSDRGFAKLRISDTGVFADVYSCNQGGQRIKTIQLK